MVECPECRHEFEPEEDGYDVAEAMMDPLDDPLDVEDGAEAILRNYFPEFGLVDRLVFEDAIKKCLTERLGVSTSAFQ